MKIETRQIRYFPNYLVTSDGRILSKERRAKRKDGRYTTYHAKEIKPLDNGNGYKTVMLYNSKRKVRVYVHRLVAQAFIPNPKKLPQINHKDENKSNNAVENLEWCTCRYNILYGNHMKKLAKKFSRPVMQFTLDDKLIAEYPSAMAAYRATGIRQGTISRVVQGVGQTAGGYKWKLKAEVKE